MSSFSGSSDHSTSLTRTRLLHFPFPTFSRAAMANGFKSAMSKVDGLFHHHRRRDGNSSNSGRSTSPADLASQRRARKKDKARKRSERALARRNATKALASAKQQRLDRFQSAFVRPLFLSIPSKSWLAFGISADLVRWVYSRNMTQRGQTMGIWHTVDDWGWTTFQDRISLLLLRPL